MQIPTTYLYLTGEAFALLLLVVCLLVYFYFRDIKQWREIVDRIKERYQELKELYNEERERGDMVRSNLQTAQQTVIELQTEIDQLNETNREQQDEIELLNEQLEGQKEQYELAQKKLEEMEIEKKALHEDIEEKDRRIVSLTATIEELEANTQPLTSSIYSDVGPAPLNAEFDDTDADNMGSITLVEAKTESGSGPDTTDWVPQSIQEQDRLKNLSSKQLTRIRELERQLTKLEAVEPETGNSVQDMQKQKQMLSEAETCISILEAELDTMTQRVTELEGNGESEVTPQVQQLTQKLSESETCIEILEGEIDGMVEKIAQLEGGNPSIGEGEADPAQLTQKLAESETCINILETELDSMAEKITQLETQLAGQSDKGAGDDEVTPGMSI